jgi:hypothetical protein
VAKNLWDQGRLEVGAKEEKPKGAGGLSNKLLILRAYMEINDPILRVLAMPKRGKFLGAVLQNGGPF